MNSQASDHLPTCQGMNNILSLSSSVCLFTHNNTTTQGHGLTEAQEALVYKRTGSDLSESMKQPQHWFTY